MRILHLADLHIGKKVNGFDMIGDQIYALKQIIYLVEKKAIEVVLIAGDIYDTKVPSSESVKLFDDFLTCLNEMKVKVVMISGNHDSQERLSFARNLLRNQEVYISGPFEEKVEKVSLRDEYGPLNFYLLPFIKPINVKKYYPDIELNDFQGAIEKVMEATDIDEEQRNVIVAHQYIVGAATSDSEELYIGGIEAISADLFDRFDYVAMGHIHKKQSFRNGTIRYPGSLLKYSKSESSYKKSLTIVDIKEKGTIDIYEEDIEYLRDMRSIEGYYMDIIQASEYDDNKTDYLHVTLYDEDPIPDVMARIREIYPNLMTLVYKNSSTDKIEMEKQEMRKSKDPFDLFNEFYEYRNNRKLDDRKSKLVKDIINDVWGDI